jgi:hypothetical protein
MLVGRCTPDPCAMLQLLGKYGVTHYSYDSSLLPPAVS